MNQLQKIHELKKTDKYKANITLRWSIRCAR